MLRKVLIIAVAATLTGLCFTGCRKSSDDSNTAAAQPVPEVKTAAEYDSEAEKEITKGNYAGELDRLEKEIETDMRADQ